MRYQVRDISQVHTIEKRDVSIDAALQHFMQYGYEYLYIVQGEHIKDVISYHEFIKYGLDFRKRNYILAASVLDGIDVESYLEKKYSLNRLVVLKDEKLLFEINLMTEPELLHSVERELFALRFLPLFRTSIANYLKEYEKIYVISNDEIFRFIKDNLYACNLVREDFYTLQKRELGDDSVLLDYQYGSKLRKRYLGNQEQFIMSLYTLVEREAFHRLITYCENKTVNLCMLRIPNYDSIKNLSGYEADAVQYKKGFLDLICDDNYLNAFCNDLKSKNFIMQRGASRSVRHDNGIWVTQGDCCEDGISVTNGIRFNNYTDNGYFRTVHFFGPCIVFGMLVTNEETIPERYKIACNNAGLKINVENHGGLHGNNVLNSLIGALATPVTSKDVVVIIDYFDDLPKEEYISVVDYGDIFDEKTNQDTWFLDHPVHCNGIANGIIAEYLCKSLERKTKDNVEFSAKVNPAECDEFICTSRHFTISNAVGIKTKNVLCEKINDKWGNAAQDISGMVIFEIENLDDFRRMVDGILSKTKKLVICYAFDHLQFERQRDYVTACNFYRLNNNVVLFQMNPYFNVFNYETGKMYGNKDNLKYIVEDFLETIILPKRIQKCYFIRNQITRMEPECRNIIDYSLRNNLSTTIQVEIL